MNRSIWLLPLASLVACTAGDPDAGGNEEEVITTVVLSFTPASGAPLEFTWADVEQDGTPTIDPVVLADADDYTLAVRFLNAQEDPPEDITTEVDAESDQHQVLFLGTAVQGPATGTNAAAVITHAYADTDENGYPVGLSNAVTTITPGSGVLQVVLRHLPPEEGGKNTTVAEDVAAGGLAAIGGSTDVDVEFVVTIE